MIIISCACHGDLASWVSPGSRNRRNGWIGVFTASPSWLSKESLLNTTQMPKFGCASRAVSTSALETHTFPSSVLYHSLTGLLREHLPRIIVSLTIVAIKYPAM